MHPQYREFYFAHLSHTGSELRSWLLFCSLPVLLGVLPQPYITHFALLVASVYLLMSEISQVIPYNFQGNGWASSTGNIAISICQLWIVICIPVLKWFFLAGDKRCTMNMHLLIHLSQCVQDWGPLWAYSCFQFESVNNYLKKLFHGTCDMSEQVCFLFLLHYYY